MFVFMISFVVKKNVVRFFIVNEFKILLLFMYIILMSFIFFIFINLISFELIIVNVEISDVFNLLMNDNMVGDESF